MQVNLVGKAQTSYLPGVLVPEVNAGGAAELAGFKAGDIILRVGDYEVAATSKQVGADGRAAVLCMEWQQIAQAVWLLCLLWAWVLQLRRHSRSYCRQCGVLGEQPVVLFLGCQQTANCGLEH